MQGEYLGGAARAAVEGRLRQRDGSQKTLVMREFFL